MAVQSPVSPDEQRRQVFGLFAQEYFEGAWKRKLRLRGLGAGLSCRWWGVERAVEVRRGAARRRAVGSAD